MSKKPVLVRRNLPPLIHETDACLRVKSEDDLEVDLMVGGLATLHALFEAFATDDGPAEHVVNAVQWPDVARLAKVLHLQFYTASVFNRLEAAVRDAQKAMHEARRAS